MQNIGIVWSPTHAGRVRRYVKQHLVPFGEYIPFRGMLTQLIGRLKEIPKDFAPGDQVGVLHIDGDHDRRPDVLRGGVRRPGPRASSTAGAELIVVQTNNATYAGTGQLDQQFAISRYRAIESGRQVVVASTDGISGFFAADGIGAVAQMRSHTQVVLERAGALATGVTLGVRLGFWVDLLLSLARAGTDRRRGLGQSPCRTGRIAA